MDEQRYGAAVESYSLALQVPEFEDDATAKEKLNIAQQCGCKYRTHKRLLLMGSW